ncbi:peptidylprolyl isomerase [Porphyromonas crevioricanis]|nr:FKBP-type peptidyl-prolyl cis-trans isomerase [Porphyromonas crevioricanis]KGN90162.1 peptidylprolyl isomerase [Porphyromonas crevioricanis]KGN94917.1 peptidylprolyl isomerase [Porphyromonas crevioricanis]GAD05020.1 FKBP-type peptidyl-prolyl cis-trans isomerase FklB [Porphyromonas crevioricanis JCM 15906]
MDKISYALGLSIANNFRATGIETVDMDEFVRAMNDVMHGKQTAITYEEAQQVLNSFFAALQERVKDQNKEAGKEFLKINGMKRGVTTTETGLQYEILVKGDGPKPKLEDTVRCHYHGTLINGEVFDSSKQRGEPAEFPLKGVISGWTEVLQLMPVGSTWRVTIPSELAYGERGAGSSIGPNSTLIFDIELQAIV